VIIDELSRWLLEKVIREGQHGPLLSGWSETWSKQNEYTVEKTYKCDNFIATAPLIRTTTQVVCLHT